MCVLLKFLPRGDASHVYPSSQGPSDKLRIIPAKPVDCLPSLVEGHKTLARVSSCFLLLCLECMWQVRED